MHVECYGSGSRIYFGLHGWSGDHATFAPLTRYLPAGVALYSADLPGYGRSPAPRRWELAEITDEIASAISGVDSPVTVIGNCSGAVFALLAAERLAGRIEIDVDSATPEQVLRKGGVAGARGLGPAD